MSEMTTKEAIEVLEAVLSLINVNYIGMVSDVQRSLDKSIAVLSNKYNLNGRKEREDLIRNLKKLSCELPPKSFVLSKVLPDNLNKALCKAIEVMTKVHTYDKQMKELEEYLKETRSTGNEF